MILSASTIRRLKPVDPFVERSVQNGKSYGLSIAGYDIRIAEDHAMRDLDFQLGSSVEYFDMPNNVVGLVKDKSSWARQGLSVFNTVIEPGWRGYLTMELANLSGYDLYIAKGDPIAQVLFFYTDEGTEGYSGKYQDQEQGPVAARYEQ